MAVYINNLSKQELELIVEKWTSNIKKLKIPSRTQTVERIIKELTEASKRVSGLKEREGFIRSRLLDGKYLPKTKRNATSHLHATVEK